MRRSLLRIARVKPGAVESLLSHKDLLKSRREFNEENKRVMQSVAEETVLTPEYQQMHQSRLAQRRREEIFGKEEEEGTSGSSSSSAGLLPQMQTSPYGDNTWKRRRAPTMTALDEGLPQDSKMAGMHQFSEDMDTDKPPSQLFHREERSRLDDDLESVTGGMKFIPQFIKNLNPKADLGMVPSIDADPKMASFEGKEAYLREKAKPESLRRNEFRPMSLRVREEIAAHSVHKTYHEVTSEDGFGERVDEYLAAKYPQWNRTAIQRLVEQGHVYRYRRNAKKRYTRTTDRLELGEFLVVPTERYWESGIAPPPGVVHHHLLNRQRQTSDADPNIISPEDVDVQPDDATRRRSERAKVYISGRARAKALEWVLYKNEHVVVINKPAGMPMEPQTIAVKGKDQRVASTSINIQDLLDVYRFTYASRPLICNRLDTEASGIVVLARTANAHRALGRMFMRRVMPNDVFWAFLSGTPKSKNGRIRMHIERDDTNPGQLIARATPTKTSRVALAEFVVNATAGEYGSWVSFYPLSSQLFQTRIMAAHALRCPVLGDARFGGHASYPEGLREFFEGGSGRFSSLFNEEDDDTISSMPLYLHHRKIQLPYRSRLGEYETVTAPMPAHMDNLFAKLGWPRNAEDALIIN